MARLRPSASLQWFRCAASVQMNELFTKNDDSEAAQNGTACHWLAEITLQSYLPNNKMVLPFDYIGKQAPNGIMIDDAMADAVDLYVDHILKFCQSNGLLQSLNIEQTIQAPRIHPTECGGTPDCYVWNNKTGTLDIWDLKYGYGVVEHFENTQLIIYAIGIIDLVTGGNALIDPNIRINFHIVQPRAYHQSGTIRTWSVNVVDLRAIVNTLISQADEALKPNPKAVSGNHCRNCDSINSCQTAQRASANAIDYNDKITIEIIPPDQLKLHRSYLSRAMEALKDRLSGVEAEIETLIQNGVTVDGLSLGNKIGRLKWSKSDDEIIALSSLMGADLTKIVCCTPTQAKNKLDQSLIDSYSIRPVGKKTIINSDETRAANVFGAKTKGN